MWWSRSKGTRCRAREKAWDQQKAQNAPEDCSIGQAWTEGKEDKKSDSAFDCLSPCLTADVFVRLTQMDFVLTLLSPMLFLIFWITILWINYISKKYLKSTAFGPGLYGSVGWSVIHIDQRITGSIPGHSKHPCCGLTPGQGVGKKATCRCFSHSSMFLSLSKHHENCPWLKIKEINTYINK